MLIYAYTVLGVGSASEAIEVLRAVGVAAMRAPQVKIEAIPVIDVQVEGLEVERAPEGPPR